MITKFNGYSPNVNVIQESRMRENFMYGLTRVRRKQNFNITAPSSYSTIFTNYIKKLPDSSGVFLLSYPYL
jgi:hypothetical protein